MDKRIKKGFVELFDVSKITESQIDKNGLERIAKKVRDSKKRSMGSKLAIVVSQGTSFDQAKYYRQIAFDVHNIIVFNSRRTAEIWLGVE